jgi:hypothetical protein
MFWLHVRFYSGLGAAYADHPAFGPQFGSGETAQTTMAKRRVTTKQQVV